MKVKKGMSQTLALIVAASVLMMTALTVIFLAQGALGDLGQDSSNRGCNGALDSQGQVMSVGDSAPMPPNCVTEDDNYVNGAPGGFDNTPAEDQFWKCSGGTGTVFQDDSCP